MGTITIRNLDDELIGRIKAKAKSAGRSMESELRRQLEEVNRRGVEADTFEPDPAELERLARVAEGLKGPDGRFRHGPELADYMQQRRKALFGDRVFPSSLEILRQIRDEDPLTSPPDAGYP
jgi:plasmid stability protein